MTGWLLALSLIVATFTGVAIGALLAAAIAMGVRDDLNREIATLEKALEQHEKPRFRPLQDRA